LPDALGSSVALTDSTGTLQTQYTYEPFGNTTVAGATSTNPLQYTGRENDGTGLYYYRARYYSPRLQRFISEDPIGFGGGDVNLYAYVGNDPVNAKDPLGLWLPEFHRDMTHAVATGCGMSEADANALAGANMGVDFSFWGWPSLSTLNPWSGLHGMPGSGWQSYSAGQFRSAATAGSTGNLQALAQGLDSLQDSYAHDVGRSALGVMLDHLPGIFGGYSPDDPSHPRNTLRADQATAATQNAIRDFMKARGNKPKCTAAA
jgi:RHS repeat-associated protein